MQIHKIPFRAMACQCELVLATSDAQTAKSAGLAAIEEVHRIELKYSRYQPDSIISIINAAAGKQAVACDDETWYLLERAEAMYQLSDGLFDISSGVLRRAWNFNVAKLPSEERLFELCQLINWSSVEKQDHHLRLPLPGMELDFGGFGKEYAADRAGEKLSEHQIKYGYVNLGGDIHIVGPKPDGQPWVIGIQDPRDKSKIIAHIQVARGALATSGDYEKYFELDGQRYCHILKPSSGHPVQYWRTVSVVASSASLAGSISSIAMLKEKAGLAFLESTGTQFLAMDQQGKIHLNKV